MASQANLASGDSAALASVLVTDYGLTAQKDIGLLEKADLDVIVNGLGLRSISRKKFEALWLQLGAQEVDGGGEGGLQYAGERKGIAARSGGRIFHQTAPN